MAKSRKQIYAEWYERKWAKVLEMPKIPCECGCNMMIPPLTKQFKPARFVNGHSVAGWNRGMKCPDISERQRGKKKSPESMAKRTITRRERMGGKYLIGGYKHSEQAIENNRNAQLKIDRKGENNPFFGKKHTEETRRIISEANTKERNPHWNGGTSNLPYGVEFTRKFKKIIRERDNYTCQRCGIIQKEYGRTLQIHHLDHDKFNNDPANLVVACGKCNTWASYHRDEPFRKI